MGCNSSAPDRALPDAQPVSEYDTFLTLLNEPVPWAQTGVHSGQPLSQSNHSGVHGGAGGNAPGWRVKLDWSQTYRKEGFKMRIALRPHECGNPNMLMRADGKFQGVQPQQFADFLLDLEKLPGYQESSTVETLPDGCIIKYLRVKAPLMKARDHCWKYTFKTLEDGSIFACIRTIAHPKCPPRSDAIRAYYYNASLFKMSAEEEGVMEMTEFIFQDLKGSLPPGLMNAALPAGTLQANAMEMDILKGKK